ncbi:MAG TPA: D-alanine--D-alanine ligase [Candidatus Paceibacterota bacterium]|nr:D-alanine--D-alanine ligase [Candidatus Paceibacterota bacterium]
MAKIKVGVLRGGPSSEYDVSLQTGSNVLKSLPEKYQGVDIFVDKDGTWHIDGLSHDPTDTLKKVDVIFNAMHGEYGEDGKVQQILDIHNVPYTGSQTLPAALAMNKARAKYIYNQHGLKTPHFLILKISPDENLEELALTVFRSFPMPLIIKPVGAGSSVGVSLVKSFDDLYNGLAKAADKFSDLLIEEYISGKEATVGVIDNFRRKDSYSLPVIEIRPPQDKSFFDLEAKYSGKSEEICPGNFSYDEKNELERQAILAHQSLGLRHYSRSDFIVHPRRGIYILETNTLPGLTSESLFPKALRTVGSDLPEFLEHVIGLAMNRK